MRELPEPIEFCLRTVERVDSSKPETLTPTERIISRAYSFDMEEQNGGLSQFFYNTDASAEIAEETGHALDVIGVSKIAVVFRAAASIVCRSEYKDYVGTWGGYLKQIDPEGKLRSFELQIGKTGESVDEALERFILEHRHELEKRAD